MFYSWDQFEKYSPGLKFYFNTFTLQCQPFIRVGRKLFLSTAAWSEKENTKTYRTLTIKSSFIYLLRRNRLRVSQKIKIVSSKQDVKKLALIMWTKIKHLRACVHVCESVKFSGFTENRFNILPGMSFTCPYYTCTVLKIKIQSQSSTYMHLCISLVLGKLETRI